MAIVLNLDNYTKQQIEAAEPLVRAWEKYERMIAAETVTNNIGQITSEPYEKAKIRRDKIASLRTKQKAISDQVEDILNMKNVFDEKKEQATELVQELEEMQRKWGF